VLKSTANSQAVLYLSYDGMTDPLGQSQVLPYVAGLSQLGYRFTLVSFEKPDRYSKNVLSIQAFCTENNIVWVPLMYTKHPPVLSTLIDVFRMWQAAVRLHLANHFVVVHCRSYLSALVGMRFKKRYKVKFVFDMRGFWADERVEGGIWNLNNPLYKFIHGFFKRKEIEFLTSADAIVSLTHAGKNIIESWPAYQRRTKKPPFAVIPCSVDFKRFYLQTPQSKAAARAVLGIEKNALVMSYVGSLGTWYMMHEMLQLYEKIRSKYQGSVLLFLTPEPPKTIYSIADEYRIPREEVVIRYAAHSELPNLLAASDVSLCFIRPSFSKQASSPTKLGELLAMGIPTYCNHGIGDVAENIEATDGGVVLQGFSNMDLEEAVSRLPDMMRKAGETTRDKAKSIFSMELAVASYAELYSQILEPEVQGSMRPKES